MFLDYFSYLLVLLLTFFSIYLVVTKREFIKQHRNIIFFFFIGILLYSQYSRYFSGLFTLNPGYTIKSIPMNYCRWTAILITVYAFTNKNKYLAQFIYFQAGLGFFSLVLPGGDLFILTENHRNLGYLFDHYMIAMMTVFLIYIDRIKISKKFMYIGIIYSIIVPFSLLPYALINDHNVYYILDGVFIKQIVGNNQIIISVLYVIGMCLYYFIMYKIGIRMANHSETSNETHLFKPIYPWIILATYIIVGLFVTHVFIDSTPSQIVEFVDTYQETPIKELDDLGYVYEATKDGETLFFVQPTQKFDEVSVLTEEGTVIPLIELDGLYYFSKSDTSEEQLVIILYKNRDQEDQKIRVYPLNSY